MQDKADLVVDSCESIADKLFNAINHAKDPNKTALIVKKERCSYANLRNRSFSLAALLLANKVSRVALCTGRTFDMYTTIAASIMSGVTYVPLTLINPCEKSAFICAHSQSSHIFIAPEAVSYAAKMLLNMPQETLKSIDIICTNSVALELKNAVQEAIANTQSVAVANTQGHVDAKSQAKADAVTQGAADISAQTIELINAIIAKSIIYDDTEESMAAQAQLFDFELARSKMSSSDIMHILYTSGTTGAPKGVMVTRANWSKYFDTITKIYRYQESDIFSNFAEITFDISLQDPICAWICGATVVCATKRDVMNAVKFIEKNSITIVHITPAMVSYIKKSGMFKVGALPSVRLSIFIGEALWYKQAYDYSLLCPNTVIYNTYGPTEATVAVSIFEVEKSVLSKMQQDEASAAPDTKVDSAKTPLLHDIVPLGYAFDGVEFCVCDEDGVEKGEGEVGELLIGGPQVTAGYWQMPEKNANAFIERNGSKYYRTGDLVCFRLDENSKRVFYYIGRDGDMLKLHGFRVSLYEVDEQFGALTNYVVRAIAYEVPDEGGRSNELVLAVEGADEKECELLYQKGRAHVAVYMQPAYVLALQDFPLNVNGKVDRKAIKQLLMSKYCELSGYTDVS